MDTIRRPIAAGALLALACCLALLGPGAAGRAAAGPDTPASLTARPAAVPEPGLQPDRAGATSLAAAKRDDRQRPGPALLGVLAATGAVAPALAALARRPRRAPARGRRAATAGPRAPPAPRPAPS
jgi:hypothetical protein